MSGLVHAVRKGATKWNLGRSLCNRTISRYTPVSNKAEEVTCKTCRKRLAATEETDR